MALPESVIITDDTMREGLQIEDADIPVSQDAFIEYQEALIAYQDALIEHQVA